MKRFLIKISYTLLPVWLLLVGLATYLWITDDNTGDLMRLGLIDSGPEYTDSIKSTILPEVYYTGIDNDSILRHDTCDVLVIGDSFSHGGGVGKEGDYVNYLARESGRKVVVFTPQDPTLSSPMQVAFDVLNLGLIDSTRVKNLVVQEVERYVISRHCSFTLNHSVMARPKPKQEPSQTEQKKDVSPLLRVKDFIFYHLFGANPIYTAQLSKPLFGGKDPSKLYFYNEDVKHVGDNSKVRQQVVDCFDHVIAKARERGVNLVIVIACDKYDMYQDFILDNSYPASTLNEDIQRWMEPELDRFIFSKQVLHPLVERGVKDVYLFNDTHWSPSSSLIVAREVIKKLK